MPLIQADFTGHPRLGLPARADAIERAKRSHSDGLVSSKLEARLAQ